MKKYTNITDKLRAITFEDGTAQFLMRGQSFTTDKVVVVVDNGIKVTEVKLRASNTQQTTTTAQKESSSNSNDSAGDVQKDSSSKKK